MSLTPAAAVLALPCATQAPAGTVSGAAAPLRGHEVLTLRDAQPGDCAALHALCAALASADLDLFGAGRPVLDDLARCVGPVDRHAVSLVAQRGEGAGAQLVGLARLCADPSGIAGEFAILVHPAARRRGLGRLLLERLLAECRRRRLTLVRSVALPHNAAMLALARACGFQRLPAADGSVELAMVLAAQPAPTLGALRPAVRR